MLNFDYSIPTEIFFGAGKIEVLGKKAKKLGNKTLLVYGKGSIKKNGIYDDVISQLESNSIEIFELDGIQANPLISDVKKGIQICKKNNIDFILAVGGGSSIDTTKAIAVGFYYDGDPWDILEKKAKIINALPIATILTLSATGSEMNASMVISNGETNQKLSTSHIMLYPKFSILDPKYTYSVSPKQTAAGVTDIMSHVFEQYFSNTKGTFLTDKISEAILKTCVAYANTAINEPTNYEARANIMRASSLALNRLIGYDKVKDWAAHKIEHELSAIYDITHGVGLAILTSNRMTYVLSDNTVDKFVEYAINVRNISNNGDKMKIAKQGIQKTREFFDSINMPSTLKEVGIGEGRLEEMAERIVLLGDIGNFKKLNKEDVLNILKMSL